ncbi:hypothetical protein QZH41_013747 [Actinostola sp. cb2023]|nr:hypothetical protein QZH41_013747 [Actinostola sp. cb2023]
MSETNELANKLARRTAINEGESVPRRQLQVFNPYTEFKEFSRRQIKDFEKMFKTYDVNNDHYLDLMDSIITFNTVSFICRYDVNNDHYLDLMEIKLMMEKLGAPQTHVGLKEMIKQVDEDNDGKVCYREFLLVFRKSAAGELLEDSGLFALAQLAEVNVDEVGVGGAANFFEAKIKQVQASSKYELEILEEQEERKKEAEAAKKRKELFRAKQAAFGVS